MSVQTHKSFVRLRNTILDILDENREVCDCPIDCQVNNSQGPEKYERHHQKTIYVKMTKSILLAS